MARYIFWFSEYRGSLLIMVLYPLWLAPNYGSLHAMACSSLWFSRLTGSLRLVVLFLWWLAIMSGSLYYLARSGGWFSRYNGSLYYLVLLRLWLAFHFGSLRMVATIVWSGWVVGILGVSYSYWHQVLMLHALTGRRGWSLFPKHTVWRGYPDVPCMRVF